MRGLLIRTVRSVLPVAALAAGAGYLFAQVAGAYFANDRDDGRALADTLAWRLPFTLAAWSGGMVFVFELFRSMWGPKPTPPKPKPKAVDAEQLLLELLAQADAAEERRQSGVVAAPKPTVADDTPPPRAEPLPLPDLKFPLDTAGS